MIRDMSMFTPISADPFNPLLMQAVPPKKMDALHASKSQGVRISTPVQGGQTSPKPATSPKATSPKLPF
ncbi:unnamed protein product [Gongylonema pulchrum]|uniref:Uncharacterized protein n=1 Tax=Gongylonema pulchrum TaxID=637853 RepID=A0A183DDF6_9BILA|nr:unnamed protein product [Gongylonema pulchrum]